jgi:hypothetical protein
MPVQKDMGDKFPSLLLSVTLPKQCVVMIHSKRHDLNTWLDPATDTMRKLPFTEPRPLSLGNRLRDIVQHPAHRHRELLLIVASCYPHLLSYMPPGVPLPALLPGAGLVILM